MNRMNSMFKMGMGWRLVSSTVLTEEPESGSRGSAASWLALLEPIRPETIAHLNEAFR